MKNDNVQEKTKSPTACSSRPRSIFYSATCQFSVILLFSLPILGHVIVLLSLFYGPAPCMYLMMAAILYLSYIDTVWHRSKLHTFAYMEVRRKTYELFFITSLKSFGTLCATIFQLTYKRVAPLHHVPISFVEYFLRAILSNIVFDTNGFCQRNGLKIAVATVRAPWWFSKV